jgi:hypothetical protein
VSSLKQLLPDSLLLKCLVHGKVRQVSAKHKIRDRAADTDQQLTLPRCYDDIRISQHGLNTIAIVNGAALSKCGPVQHVDEFVDRKSGLYLIADGH